MPRKFLVVVDDSPEFETALRYAARRARSTGGRVALLRVIGRSRNIASAGDCANKYAVFIKAYDRYRMQHAIYAEANSNIVCL